MKKRNTIMAGMTLGVSAAAIWAGVLVTSSAIASEPASDEANVTMLAPDPDGDGAISCQFDGVDIEVAVATASATALPVGSTPADGQVISGVVSASATALPEGSAPADGQVISGTGTIQDPGGLLEDSGTVTVESSGGLPVLVVVNGGEVRPGTPEECAALQPEGIPAP